MTDALFTLLHHRGFEMRKRPTPEKDWLGMIGNRHPHPELAIWDFMAEINANVMANAQRTGRTPTPPIVRVILSGVPYWTPQPERMHGMELDEIFAELDRKAVEKSFGNQTQKKAPDAPHGAEIRVNGEAVAEGRNKQMNIPPIDMDGFFRALAEIPAGGTWNDLPPDRRAEAQKALIELEAFCAQNPEGAPDD